jgi:hypothetical protein
VAFLVLGDQHGKSQAGVGPQEDCVLPVNAFPKELPLLKFERALAPELYSASLLNKPCLILFKAPSATIASHSPHHLSSGFALPGPASRATRPIEPVSTRSIG